MQGLINNEFEHLMISKRAEDPQFVVETIQEYCAEVKAILSQMKNDMYYPLNLKYIYLFILYIKFVLSIISLLIL